MAVEKFIRGKRDECHHDGKAANTRRLQQAINDLEIGEQLLVSLQVYRQREKLPEPMVTYHTEILTAWGLLPAPVEMKPGIEYQLDKVGNNNYDKK